MIKNLFLILAIFSLVNCSSNFDLERFLPSKNSLSTQDAAKFNEAKEDVKAQKLPLAFEKLSDLAAKNPKNKEILFEAAFVAKQIGESEKAIKFYKQSLILPEISETEKIEIFENIGLLHLKLNQIQEAEIYLSRVMSLDASRTNAINALGISLSLIGKQTESLEYFKMLNDLKPLDASILNNLALVQAFCHDLKSAEKNLLEASKITPPSSPNKARIDLNLALIYGLQGKMSKAEEISKKHLNKKEVMNNLGYYAALSKRQDLAKKYLEKALKETSKHYQKAWNNLQVIKKSP